MPKIVSVYGRNAFSFLGENIVVTIPFNKIYDKNITKEKSMFLSNNTGLSTKQQKVLNEIVNNPNITAKQLSSALSLGVSTINKYITQFKKAGILERVGSNKDGKWKINNTN